MEGAELQVRGEREIQEELLQAAASKYFEHASELLKELEKSLNGADVDLLTDDSGRSAAHHAASSIYEKAPEVLQHLAQLTNRCLFHVDVANATPLHLSAARHPAADIEKLIVSAGEASVRELQKRKETDSLLHFAARNAKNPEVLWMMAEKFGTDCLVQRNQFGQTPLHVAAQHLKEKEFGEAFKLALENMNEKAREKAMKPDKKGNTVLHYAAQNLHVFLALLKDEELGRPTGKLNAKNSLQQTLLHLAAIAENRVKQTPLHLAALSLVLNLELLGSISDQLKKPAETLMNLRDKNGRNVAFYACLGHNYDLISNVLYELSNVMCTDSLNNTMLHALFKKYSVRNDFDKDKWKEAFNAVIRAGCDLKMLNRDGQTCLQASELQSEDLKKILEDTDLKESLKSVMLNDKGEHAVHFFSSRYHIGTLLNAIADCCDEDQDKLLQRRPKSGPMKGGTCLHFACATGEEGSVKKLMERGLRLDDETRTGMTCIDVACDRGTLRALKSFIISKGKFRDCIRLVDPVRKALPPIDRTKASKVLATFADHVVKENLTQEAVADLENAQAQPLQACLLRALELDSTEVLRSGLCLYKPDEMEMEDFSRFFALQLASSSPPNLHNQMEFRRRFSKDAKKLSIIEIAVFFEKVELACDLVLIRQTDLIPVAIGTLILLKQNLQHAAGNDKILRLQERVTNIVTNFLDALYPRTETSMQSLLFRFLKGDLWEAKPKWPLPTSLHHKVSSKDFSIVEMVEILGGHDLCATECMHRLTDQEWESDSGAFPVFQGSPKISPNKKFWIHSVSLLVFLVFFAWFISDFKRALQNPISVLPIFCYAASFVGQEIRDLVRLRRCERFKMLCLSWRMPIYFKDALNVCDLAAILLLLVGTGWFARIAGAEGDDPTSYACQMVLSSAFLLWGFRSLSVLSSFENIGPVLTMMRLLLVKDLLPFLLILFVIFYSFGVFFFNLLFPVVTASAAETNSSFYGWNVVKQTFVFPALLMFGMFERGDLATADSGTEQQVRVTANPEGFDWLWNILMFVFLMVVNIVMVNLLIALFNLTVTKIVGKATAVWRRKYFDKQLEFRDACVIPPPVSFLYDVVWAVKKLVDCRKNKVDNQEEDRKKPESQWKDEDYPDEYKEFLWYQAEQLRQLRATLNRPMERNKDEVERLRAATENSLLKLETRLNVEFTATQNSLLELETRLNENMRRQMWRLVKKSRKTSRSEPEAS